MAIPANDYDSWMRSKSSPKPVVESKKSVSESALDILLAREEFEAAGQRVSEGLEEGNFGQVATGGLASLFTAATFVVPWGSAGRFVTGGGAGRIVRAATSAAMRRAGEAAQSLPTPELPQQTVTQLARRRLESAGLPAAEPKSFSDSLARLGELGREGGFTWDPRTGRYAFDDGYAVAVVRGYEVGIPRDEFTSLDVIEYLNYTPEGQSRTVAERLGENPRNMVGGWVETRGNEEFVFLDVSTAMPDLDSALRIGGALNEQAVFDFKSGSDVRLSDNPDYLPGGKEYTPQALNRYGFADDAAEVRVVAPEGPVEPAGDLPESMLRGEGGFEADLPGDRVRQLAEQMAERHLDSPTGLAAVPPEEIAEVLGKLPEFEDFVALYRETVVSGMDQLDRRQLQPGRLLEWADLTGLSTPAYSKGADTKTSFPMALKITDSLPQAVRNGAVNLGIRIRNLASFATDDAYNPVFYREFYRIFRNVEENTGMPIEVLAMALASASQQAAPYDEVRRFARVSKLVVFRNGRAEPAPGAMEILGDDNMAKTALRGLIDTINTPDFLTYDITGQAMKTGSYAYGRLDPLYVPTYVADTVDNLGQFVIRGATGDITKAQGAIVNQIAGRTLSRVYDVPDSAMQEALWSHIRVARDGIKTTRFGTPTQTAIEPSFTGPEGSVEAIMTRAIMDMDPRLIALAKENRDKFYQDVRDGKLPAWVWDKVENRPVTSSVENLIPPEQRVPVQGRAGRLQSSMFELVNRLGPELRARLMALAAASGISLDVLVRALGQASDAIPNSVLAAGAAGAVIGGTAGTAQASDGSVTMAAGPLGGAAAGGVAGAAAAGATGALAAAARNMVKSLTLKPAKIGGQVVQPLDMMPGPASTPEMPIGAANRRIDNSLEILNNYDQTGAQQSTLSSAWQEAFLSKEPREAQQALIDTEYNVNTLLGFKGYGGAWNGKTSIDPDNLGEELTDAMIYDGYEIENYLEAMMYWNRVGNVNLTSELRTGDLPYGDADFDNALRAMERRYRSKTMALDHLEKLNRDMMDILLSEGTVTNHPEFIAYRGIGGDSAAKWLGPNGWLAARVAPELLIGAEISDPAFLAMSVSSRSAELFTNSYFNKGPLFQLRVPSDEPIVPISANIDKFRAAHTGENEILLHPNRPLRVVHIATPDEIIRNYRMLDGSRLTDNADNLRKVGGGANRGQWSGPWSLRWSKQDKQFIAVDDATGSSIMGDFNVEPLIPPPIITLEVI